MKRALAVLVTAAAVSNPVALGLPSSSDAATLIAVREPKVDARTYIRERASRSGWRGQQWQCLETLLKRESNFRPTASNGNHYGVFQEHNLKPGTPIETQTRRGLRYVRERYGSPCAALAHSNRFNWY